MKHHSNTRIIAGIHYRAVSTILADSRVSVAIYPSDSARPVLMKVYSLPLGKAVTQGWLDWELKRQQIIAKRVKL